MIFKAGTTAAVRWWKNGDHPNDESEIITTGVPGDATQIITEGKYVGHYAPPPGMADLLHTECGAPWRIHGFIESGGGRVVCPGHWIVQRTNGHWDLVRQSVTGIEDDEPLTNAQWFWYCADEKENSGEGEVDAEVVTQEAAQHATEHGHVVHVYGVLDGAEE